MPGASKQRARLCRAGECVGCALDATTPVMVGAMTIVGVEVSGAAVVICVGVVVPVSSVTAGDMRYFHSYYGHSTNRYWRFITVHYQEFGVVRTSACMHPATLDCSSILLQPATTFLTRSFMENSSFTCAVP